MAKQARALIIMRWPAFVNSVTKEENDGNHHFRPFPEAFSIMQRQCKYLTKITLLDRTRVLLLA